MHCRRVRATSTMVSMTPERLNGYILAAGLVLGAIYGAVRAFEARQTPWKAMGFLALALIVLGLAALTWIVSK